MKRSLIPIVVLVAAIVCFGSAGSATGGGRQPGVTPRILYASDWSGTSEIYSVDPSGRTPIAQLTFGPAPACHGGAPCGFIAPNPSPDGRHLLFWDHRDGDNYSDGLFVALADANGRRLVRRFTAPAYTPHDEVWAPDSRQFAYTGVDGNHLVNADGSHDRRVDGSSAGDSAPAWSPDGRLLAFSNKLGHLIVAAGNVARIIAGGVDVPGAPAWSPTGRWIAYTTAAFRIALVSPDGRRHRTIADDGYGPVWSRDGRMVAFSDGVVDIATGAVLHLDGTFAGWSPDGRTVAVRAAHSTSVGLAGTYPVDLVDAMTGAVRVRVSDDGGPSLSWSAERGSSPTKPWQRGSTMLEAAWIFGSEA
jgi:Tol biopolymer transport system component